MRHILRLEWLEDRVLLDAGIAHPDFVPLNGGQSFAGPGNTGFTPAQIKQAYGINLITFNNGTVVGDGSGTTIAIVDAYREPNIVSDLHQFDLAYGLPDPILSVVNQNGGSSLPAANAGWAEEIALDVEWAHAIAPGAKILLVEANSANYNDLFTAVHTAASTPGVVAVSMSFGGGETVDEASFDSFLTTPSGHAGVTFLASSGDSGAPPSYPSVSPNVVSVGGTTLSADSAGNILSEAGWSGSGGGISTQESQPSYQNGVVTQTTTARANPDVAYDADPNTGFWVYNSYGSPLPWQQLGGTSDAAPQWAAIIAIADQGRALAGFGSLDGPSQTLPLLYRLSASDFHDITTGGSTGSPSYSAGPGYDLVTGRGTPLANRVVADLIASSQPADLAVTASGPSSVATGTDATYTITIINNGPNAAQGVILNDTLPAGSFLVSISQTSGTDIFTFGQSGGSVSASGNIAAGSSDTFTAVVFAPYNLASGAAFNNTASVSAANPDPNSANNSATVSGSVVVVPPPSTLQDGGFETPSLGVGPSAYQYDPPASPWVFVGQAGVSGNGSGFTSGNPSAPQGSQVAFLQKAGSFSQQVTLAAGTYILSFSAAQRATYQSSSQTFQVTIDGVGVATFTPSGSAYAAFSTHGFTVAAGVHTIAFVGLNPNGGDNTVFIDQAAVAAAPAPPSQFQDGGFETPVVGSGSSAYQYDPAASPWTFVGQAGVSGNGSGFTSGNPAAPQGSQVAFLQNAGSFSQQVTLSAGTYAVTFSAAQRATYQSSSQTFQVRVDGVAVATFTPTGAAYSSLTTGVFQVAAGIHSVAFVGLNPNGGDNTAFIDQATISAVPPPPAQFQDGGFETPVVGSGGSAYQYDPASSPWAFVGQAGVSGNGSGFTSGNPSAPQGSQVAFLQNAGSFSQAVTLAAGYYNVTFSAAQRALYQSSSQTFQVRVDGVAVGTFTPSGSSYAAFTTHGFAVTAGIHTVAFVGLNPNGGDNTAFIDQASVNVAPSPPAQLQDGGFETPVVGSGGSAYQYDPAASPWTFVGQAGVSGNGSGFTSGNPAAPQGSQVAFLQNAGSFSQAVTLSAGTYTITFNAAQRATFQSSFQTFQARVDGVTVATFAPSTTSYVAFAANFTVAAGVHTVAFVGLNPNGGDNTAFIDQVAINPQSPEALRFGSPIGHRIPGLGESAEHRHGAAHPVPGLGWWMNQRILERGPGRLTRVQRHIRDMAFELLAEID
jgi:uncharacterized repeat protein (TIGR01451 family)